MAYQYSITLTSSRLSTGTTILMCQRLKELIRSSVASWRFKYKLMVFLLTIGCSAAQIQDFAIDTSGPHHVVAGYDLIFLARGRLLSGPDDMATVTVSGLPLGASAHFLTEERSCCADQLYGIGTDDPIRISTSTFTPVGTYSLSITYTTIGGVSRSNSYTLLVDPMPSAVQEPRTYSALASPLAMQNQWYANMLSYGHQFCTGSQLGTSDGLVWYYDGVRNYYQIADATGDPQWSACARLILGGYLQYVLDAHGALPGDRKRRAFRRSTGGFFPGSDRAFAKQSGFPSAGSRQGLRPGGARNRWREMLRASPARTAPRSALKTPHDSAPR